MINIEHTSNSAYLPPEKQIPLRNLNRRFPSDIVYVDFGELGFSVRARREIHKGERILTFHGPVLSFEETVANGPEECMALQFEKGQYIDTQPPGRFVNHSCEPNAGIRGSFDLIALEDIPRDREIRFDYSTTMDEDHYTMPCKCGKPSCRGLVTDFKLLPMALQKKYLDLGVVPEFISLK